jgi:NAD(P)-dependent dehydrogenase (short-subunit alcohol dehydrogenase family)
MRYPGRSALVTGGGQGIGKAIAAELYAQGANVLIMQRDGAAARRTIAELEEAIAGDGELAVYAGSVSSSEDVTAAFDTAESVFDEPVQVLVNNARGGGQVVLVTDVEEEFWDDVVGVNLKAPFCVCASSPDA